MQRSPLPHNTVLSDWLRENRSCPNWTFWGAHASASLNTLAAGSVFAGRLAELAGRSVLLAIADQLTAALALIELDGVARRLTLCTPDVAQEHLLAIVADTEADAIVSDRAAPAHERLGVDLRVICSPEIRPTKTQLPRPYRTEWILL